MRKKILCGVSAFAAVVSIAGLVLLAQFKGNAVRGEYELYIGSQTGYEEAVDSLMPHIRHRAAFRSKAQSHQEFSS